MAFPIKPICSVKKTHSDGTATIFLQYCFSASNRTLLNTEIRIPPIYWNTKQLCVSNKLPMTYGSSQKMNEELVKLMCIAEDLVSFAANNRIADKGNFVKKSFCSDIDISALKDIKARTITLNLTEQKVT
ncbi:MAG: Arm DNA-binding domain-containing protein [Parafilimonas sp.]